LRVLIVYFVEVVGYLGEAVHLEEVEVRFAVVEEADYLEEVVEALDYLEVECRLLEYLL
jgi:hypothetical protein